MPELPEVETIRRQLYPSMVGALINDVTLSGKPLRFPFPNDFKQRLRHRRIDSLDRHGKYLFAILDNGEYLIMHLGMSGHFIVSDTPTALVRHDHVCFLLAPASRSETPKQITYHDPRRFGFIFLLPDRHAAHQTLFSRLGPDPLATAHDPHKLANQIAQRLPQNSTRTIKAALLDQSVIAGIGNIYACEALFHARISPRRPIASLLRANHHPRADLIRLAKAINYVLAEALASGGSTLRDHRHTDGSPGYFQHYFNVYDREGKSCSHHPNQPIQRIVQQGRSSFLCPKCQK